MVLIPTVLMVTYFIERAFPLYSILSSHKCYHIMKMDFIFIKACSNSYVLAMRSLSVLKLI